jgi:Cof subfamily protein (haloacid dehalogenase superfamily)
MVDYKVLFLDVDGTIIRPDDSIEESTKYSIKQVQAKGIEVFLATGRPLHELKELSEDLKINSFIGYNGAHGIYKGQELFYDPMKAETVQHLLDIAKKHNHEVVLYTNEKNIFSNLHHSSIKEFMTKLHLYKNDLYSPEINHHVLGLTLVNLKPGDDCLYNNVAGIHLSQVNVPGLEHCYDVIRVKVNKGYGIDMVLRHLNIKKQNAIAFGDGLNDKEMLRNVGYGFAMGNAHPDLFQYAYKKTTAVTDSGIYNGLKSIGLVD